MPAAHFVGWALVYIARFADAEREFERAMLLAAWFHLDPPAMDRWRRDRLPSWGLLDDAMAQVEAGDWTGAVEVYEAAIAGFRSKGATGIRAFDLEACALLARSLALRGD